MTICKDHLYCISGNVGAGKSTLGPIIAKHLDAEWMPECNISQLFLNFLAQNSAESKLISEIAFASTRVATIQSKFISGFTRIATERYLWDDWVFYRLWSKKYNLHVYDKFMSELNDILRLKSDLIRTTIIYLDCPVEVITSRLKSRNLPYDEEFLRNDTLTTIEEIYKQEIEKIKNDSVLVVDVTDVNIEDSNSVQKFLEKIT